MLKPKLEKSKVTVSKFFSDNLFLGQRITIAINKILGEDDMCVAVTMLETSITYKMILTEWWGWE